MFFIKNRVKIILSLAILALMLFALPLSFCREARAETADYTYVITYNESDLEMPWHYEGNGLNSSTDSFSSIINSIDYDRYVDKKYQDATLIFDNLYVSEEMTFEHGNYTIKAPNENGVALGYKALFGGYLMSNGQDYGASSLEIASTGIRVSNGAKVTFKDCQVYASDLQMGASSSDMGEIVFDNSTYYLPHFYLTETENKFDYQLSLANEYDNESKLSFVNGSVFTDFMGEVVWVGESPMENSNYLRAPRFEEYNVNLSFISSKTEKATFINTLKDLHVENLTMDFSNAYSSEKTARLVAQRSISINGDVNYVASEGEQENLRVNLEKDTSLEIKNLSKAITVIKSTYLASHGDVLAVGDETSLNLIDLVTSYEDETYNDTAIEETVISQAQNGENTHQIALSVNYYKIQINGKGDPITGYVERGKTLLEQLDGIVNKEVADYELYSNEYYEGCDLIQKDIDVETFVANKQYATLYLYYRLRQYEIKYENLKGANIKATFIDNFNSTNIDQVGESQHIPSKNALENLPSENEFIFDGWSYTLNGEKINAPNYQITITEDLCRGFTLYARWINVYAVTIDNDNGEESSVQYVREGQKAEAPTENPTKEKHNFLNWYDSADAEKTAFDFDKGITQNVMIKANWQKIWEVIFDATDAEEVGSTFDQDSKTKTVLIPDGEAFTQYIQNPTRELYKFQHWFDAEDDTQAPFDFNNINKDVTLKVKWIKKTYNVIFVHQDKDKDLANWPSNIENVEIYSQIQAPTIENIEGYRFVEWVYKDDMVYSFDFSRVHNDRNSELETIELYAKWEYVYYDITYVTTLPNQEIPTVIEEKTKISIWWVENSKRLVLPTISEMNFAEDSKFRLFEFKGWALEEGASTGQAITEYAVTSSNYDNMPTFYAVWVAKQFTITFNKVGEEVVENWPQNITAEALQEIDISTLKPTRNGYHFVGWFDAYNESAPNLLTVEMNYFFTVQWEKALYGVNFVTTLPNEEKGPDISLEGIMTLYSVDNSSLTLPLAQALSYIPNGYTFAGWSLVKGSSSGYNETYNISNEHLFRELTFYAVWREKTYTIEFNLKDGTNDCYIIDVDDFTGKDYLASIKNSSHYGAVLDGENYKYLITVGQSGHKVTLPNVRELFVNNGAMMVAGYRVGDTVLTDNEIDFNEVKLLVDSEGVLSIAPIFESTNLGRTPIFNLSCTYGNSVAYAWTQGDATAPAIVFEYDAETGYKLLVKHQEQGNKSPSFDGEFFDAGIHYLELVILLEGVDLDTINSYDDLKGLKHAKVQDVTEIGKKKIYFDGDAYIIDEFEYDGNSHKAHFDERWLGIGIYFDNLDIVCEEQTDAGDYSFNVVIKEPQKKNYILCYSNGTEAPETGIKRSWQIDPFYIIVGTIVKEYNGQEQSLCLNEVVGKSIDIDSIPNWSEALENQILVCDEPNTRVEDNVLYFTNAGFYTIRLNDLQNYSFSTTEFIALEVMKMQVARPTAWVTKEWTPNVDIVSLADFFSQDVSSMVKITEDSDLRPTTIGSQIIKFELIDPVNYEWGSGFGLSSGLGGEENSLEIIEISWCLEKKKLSMPSIKFYSGEAEFNVYSFNSYGEIDISKQLYENEDFDYRIEIEDSSILAYCYIESPISPSSLGYKTTYIKLYDAELTCWKNSSGGELYSDRLTVSWNVDRFVMSIDWEIEYRFNSNNEFVWEIIFLTPEGLNFVMGIDYDVIFFNMTLASSAPVGGDDDGSSFETINEAPPFAEGDNLIGVELVVYDGNYSVLSPSRMIDVNYSASGGNQGGNQGGAGGGGQGENGNQSGGCGGNIGATMMLASIASAVGAVAIVAKKIIKKED